MGCQPQNPQAGTKKPRSRIATWEYERLYGMIPVDVRPEQREIGTVSYYQNALTTVPGLMKRGVDNRQQLLRREAEDFLRAECEALPERQKRYWARDYSSIDAYLRSVEPNRDRWRQAVGLFDDFSAPMAPLVEPFMEDDKILAQWVTITLKDNFRARGVLGLPKDRLDGEPLPVVLCQHGVSSSPERVFGFDDESDIYHAYGRRLIEDGYAVFAPLKITMAKPLARINRLCLMLGGTVWGLEIAVTRRLIDYLETWEELDCSRLAMWGISMGGTYTMFTVPLEPRIKVALTCAWFNDRVKKMVIEDPRYSCFLPLDVEHIWVPHWLREFGDSDVASLICPRPHQIQTGKADAIAWAPMVAEEFERAKAHYDRLGIGDRIELDLHEAGHEISYDAGLRFLNKWLRKGA